MKKVSVSAAIFCLLLTAGAVFAQNKATNFAGNWELDVSKSKLPERTRVESMTLNVTQTDKEIKVETNTKRAARPEADRAMGGGNGGTGQGGGMRRGGMMGGGNGTVAYNLDGKETTVEMEAPAGRQPYSVSLNAKMEKNGRLKLTSSRSVDTPNGSISIKTTETWELTDGGKALKVSRDTETPRGTESAEMYFTKSNGNAYKGTVVSGDGIPVPDGFSGKVVTIAPDSSLSGTTPTPKRISGGVLNGKALQLVKPGYPAEARESKASGAVNVQIEIDEQGNVVSAKAVSGDAMLREASEEAARNSKFAPIMLQGVPVKVTGIIVYNFVAP